MDYTQASGYAVDAQGRRQFVDRNDAEGVGGTYITEADLNAPQNEIVGAIKKSGQEPNADNEEQLGLALLALSGPQPWSEDVSAAIGGYPKNAIVGDGTGKFWRSLVGGNTQQTGSANWLSAFGGRIIGVRTYASAGTQPYAASVGTGAVFVIATGGSGAGGGTEKTGSGQVAAALGGTAGSTAIAYYSSNFDGVSITVGAAGVPNPGKAGGNGGNSSFGSLLTAPGGAGGSVGTANDYANASSSGGAVGSMPSGSGIIISAPGAGSTPVIIVGNSGQQIISGAGGASFWGPGGVAQAAGSAANVDGGHAPGAGGSGAAASELSSGALPGGAGAAGIVIVVEMSS
ncbi:hypothetical protein KBX73_09995 [Acetobacter persici]|uniref:hypothetical protein n=1 Tax=Acetobacter persici TaxID=1076596 RepID=UPI0020CEA09F|nr:hypothetical protein [Acetobacter persici]MCP9320095.1 hypothetical protein [Acetobacter persici]